MMKSLRKSSKCRKVGNLNNVNQTESEFVSLALKGGGNNFSEIGPFACCILHRLATLDPTIPLRFMVPPLTMPRVARVPGGAAVRRPSYTRPGGG